MSKTFTAPPPWICWFQYSTGYGPVRRLGAGEVDPPPGAVFHNPPPAGSSSCPRDCQATVLVISAEDMQYRGLSKSGNLKIIDLTLARHRASPACMDLPLMMDSIMYFPRPEASVTRPGSAVYKNGLGGRWSRPQSGGCWRIGVQRWQYRLFLVISSANPSCSYRSPIKSSRFVRNH